jgi:hypothetical protein
MKLLIRMDTSNVDKPTFTKFISIKFTPLKFQNVTSNSLVTLKIDICLFRKKTHIVKKF